MHSSVLQNKHYIRFAEEHCVDVMVISGVKKAIESHDSKAATYTEKDKSGKEHTYMVEFPGMTAAQLEALDSSPAARYHSPKGAIPYTTVVDPYTLKEIQGFTGGISSKTLMETVTGAEKTLVKEHGRGVSKKLLELVKRDSTEIRSELDAQKYHKALKALQGLEKKVQKQPQALLDRVAKVRDTTYAAVNKKLDEIEGAITSGKGKDAERDLRMLSYPAKGTPLEARIKKLLDQLKGSNQG